MKTVSSRYPALIGDIGGTNARFALIPGAGQKPQHHQRLACADYPDIVAAIHTYLAHLGATRPVEAVIAIANPVTGDDIRMTNHVWRFSIEETRKALGLVNLRVINDFTALALAVPRLAAHDLVQVGGGIGQARSTIGVIGPGTGLGVSGLVPAGLTAWQPLAGEGGHVSFSPTDEDEDAVLHHIRRMHGSVSAERLISGPGLVQIYEAIVARAGAPTQKLLPADVSRLALTGGDAHCVKALDLFCAMLGTVSGNLALTLGATGGVYIGGGVVPKMLDFFKASRFRQQFEAKGRLSEYIAAIPTHVIIASDPTLLGAAALTAQE